MDSPLCGLGRKGVIIFGDPLEGSGGTGGSGAVGCSLTSGGLVAVGCSGFSSRAAHPVDLCEAATTGVSFGAVITRVYSESATLRPISPGETGLEGVLREPHCLQEVTDKLKQMEVQETIKGCQKNSQMRKEDPITCRVSLYGSPHSSFSYLLQVVHKTQED